MKILVFLGSTRNSTPPKPARLGERVASACVRYFSATHTSITVELIDALEFDSNVPFKPEFAYSESSKPKALKHLAEKITSADGYIMISPEYNHSMSPALADLLNHFGSSLFAYKPSAIVTYSAGQWGGTRAAVSMRSFLSELGCLPVSAMIHVPKAHEVFDDVGNVNEDQNDHQWQVYFDRTFHQLVWWASAASSYKKYVNPKTLIKDFKRSPSQRNAP